MSVTLSGKQLLDALSLITGGAPCILTREELETEIRIEELDAWKDYESGLEQPKGFYASLDEYPDEGLYGPLGDTHEAKKFNREKRK